MSKTPKISEHIRSKDEIRHGRAIVIMASLALLFVGFATASVGPAQAAAFKTGVSLFDTVSTSDAAAAATKIKAAGGSFALSWLRWNAVAPTARPDDWDPTDPDDPNYDWTDGDHWVKSISEAGVTPFVQVYGSPTWADRCTAPTGIHVNSGAPCNPNPSDFASFLKAAAERYSGSTPGLPRVRYWQLQNEPNLFVFFNPQLGPSGNPRSPALYRNLLKAGYAALKSVDSSNIVAAAGLAPNKPPGDAVAPLHFTRELFCLNRLNRPKRNSRACRGGVPLDIFDMHPYTSGGPTHKAVGKDNVQMGDLKSLRRTIAAADRFGHTRGVKRRTPLWIVEMSWDSNRPDPGGVPMRVLRRWVPESMFRSYQAGVRVFMWMSLRDRDPGDRPWSESDQSGLFFRGETIDDDRAKPIRQAFRFPFVAFTRNKVRRIRRARGVIRRRVRGMIVWGRTATSKGGWVSIERKQRGRWRRVSWVRANRNGLFKGFVRIRRGSNRAGQVRATFRRESSAPFSLKPVRDRPARPFG